MGAFVGAEMRSTQRWAHALTPPCSTMLDVRFVHLAVGTAFSFGTGCVDVATRVPFSCCPALPPSRD